MYNPFNINYGFPAMNQMQMYRPQNYQRPQFIAKQVTNIEEARASMIDPLSTYLFVDTSTGCIYMKRLNDNGMSDFYTFKAEDIQQTEKSDPFSMINKRLDNIERMLGGSNVQSIPDTKFTTNDDKSDAETKSTTVQQGAEDD